MRQHDLEHALNKNRPEEALYTDELTDGIRMTQQLIQLTSEVGATKKHLELEEVIHGIENGYFLSNYNQSKLEPLIRRIQSHEPN